MCSCVQNNDYYYYFQGRETLSYFANRKLIHSQQTISVDACLLANGITNYIKLFGNPNEIGCIIQRQMPQQHRFYLAPPPPLTSPLDHGMDHHDQMQQQQQ